MKIYAQQVPPEYQESPLFNDEWPENVYIFGNRHFIQRAERLDEIRAALNEIGGIWDDLTSGAPQYYTSWIDALNDILPPDAQRGEYTRLERLTLAKLAAQYEWAGNGNAENKILCDVLELITSNKYEWSTIRGCCQGDWQDIIYPAKHGREWLKSFECEYFNTGSEWCIKENEDDPGYYQYCTGWNNDLIRAEIAETSGATPENIILYAFDGWSRSASYKEV